MQKICGTAAILLFVHLWWRSAGGPLAGPSFLTFGAEAAVWNFFLLFWFYFHHSFLASPLAKKWFALPARLYRERYLLVNLMAVGLVWVCWARVERPAWWSVPAPWSFGLYALELVGMAGLIWTARSPDLGELRRKAGRGVPLVVRGPAALCRHPTYFFTLVMMLSPEMPAGRGILALASVLYIFVGSRLEEQKLLVELGDDYLAYRKSTPWIFPSPGSLGRAVFLYGSRWHQ